MTGIPQGLKPAGLDMLKLQCEICMSSAAACFRLRHTACVPGEDTMLSDQPYRYLTVDEMKSLGDDSLPIDVTRDERIDSNRECMGKYFTYSFVMDFRDNVFHFLSLTVFCSQFLPSPALHFDSSAVECSVHLPTEK